MKSFVGNVSRVTRSSQSLVRPEFRKGLNIPALPHQKYGIFSKVLWPSRNQVIRIIPGYDPATGEVYRQNVNCGVFSMEESFDNYLSDTFCRATVVSRFGSVSSPFISDYAPGSPDEQAYAGETVIHNFIRGITYAVSGSSRRHLRPISEWSSWVGFGPAATLNFDRASLLMQALVFQVNGRNNVDIDTHQELVDGDGDILPLLAVVAVDNKTSIDNICRALVEPSNPGLPLDAATNNKYGAMAELNGNKLYLNTYVEPGKSASALRPSVQAPGQGWTPEPFPLDEATVKSLWHPWEDLLSYMTAQEQLELCASEFGADTVNYVIGTDPRFCRLEIPSEIKRAGLGRYADLSSGGGESVRVSGSVSMTRPVGFQKPAKSLGTAPTTKYPVQQPAQQPQQHQLNLSSIPANSGVDIDRIIADTAAMRRAAASAEDMQAEDASSLLQ